MAGPIRIAILGNATSAVSSINKTSAATSTLGTRFKAATVAAAKFAAIGLGVAVAGAAYAAVKFAQAAAEDQQAAALMAKAFQNAAGATNAQIAATETWISAQGRALGVTDDELRPALSKLVTATGDVGRAQELAALAMDVSAGSGKSLEQVAKALADAENGRLTGLGKLNIATKDAQGNTKSLVQITDELGKKFGGAATTKANTFQGQLDRLKLIASEAGESIGAKLIPYLTRFASFMLSTGIPAITKFGQGVKEQLTSAFNAVQPAVSKFASILQNQVLPVVSTVFNFLANNKPVVIAFAAVLGVGAAALVVFGAAMALVNVVLLANPITLVVLALAGLAAGLTYAYTHSEKFRAVVDKAWAGIKAATEAVFPVIQKIVSVAFEVLKTLFFNFNPVGILIKHWDKIRALTSAAWAVIRTVVSGAIAGVKGAIAGIQAVIGVVTGAWDKVKSATTTAWNAVKGAVKDAVTALINAVSGIKGQVTSALSGAGTLLLNAGKAIIQGLIDGIDSMIDSVKSKLKTLTDLIPDVKGPPSRDRTLLRENGQLIIQGLIDGFSDGSAGVEKSLTALTDLIQKHFDAKLKKVKVKLDATLDGKALDKAIAKATKRMEEQYDKVLKKTKAMRKALTENGKAQDKANEALKAAQESLQGLKDTAAAYASSIKDSVVSFGNIVGLGEGTGYSSAAQLVELLKRKVEQATQYAALITALTAAGLNTTAIQQLIDAGVEGGLGSAQAILDGGPEAIAQINSLQAQLAAVGADLGTSTASTMYGAGIQAAQGLVDGLAANADALAKQAKKLAQALVKAVKKALGIASPSKVFKDLGTQTVRGLSIGLDEVYVRRQGERLADSLTKGFSSPALAAYLDSSDANTSGQTNVTIQVQVSPTADKVAIGREVQSALDAYYAVGGRTRA